MRIQKIIVAISILLLVTVFIVGLPVELDAQCPMCRIAAESNMKHGGGTAGKGLNNGIMYMLAAPYVLIGTIAFLWWRNRKTKEELGEA